MTRIRNLVIGLAVLALLLLAMVTYLVPFNKAVVVTGLGNVATVKNADGTEAGLYFKAPWPIQRVAREYDLGVRTASDRLEQTNTADNRSVVLNTFVFWRIDDPLAFYRTFGSEAEAARRIRDRLRATRGVIGRYNFSDLFNTDPAALKRDEIEAEMAAAVQAALADGGVAVERVGIQRIVLGQAVTQAVTEFQRRQQEALAQVAESEGQSLAANIGSNAENLVAKINAFAELRADEFRAQAGPEQARLLAQFDQDPDFAKLIIELEAVAEMLGTDNTTFFLQPGIFGDLFDVLDPNYDAATGEVIDTAPTAAPAAE
jgi:membrane protease subunit HflC